MTTTCTTSGRYGTSSFRSASAIDHARRTGAALDRTFSYQLGQTMYWSMRYLETHNNSLCSFMWAGLLSDPEVFAAVIPRDADATRRQLDMVLVRGVEQLRRFPLDRRHWVGQEQTAAAPQWVDRYRPDDYHWKCDPLAVWQVTGPATNELYCAIDYLYAYWLMRYYRLDAAPVLAAYHENVLRATPDVARP
jgi:hypothetical protein